MTTVISVEDVTKKYDLGVVGSGTLGRDLNRWWARLRHLPDPETTIEQSGKVAISDETMLALDNVSFAVQQGDTLGIIGRNGAGKSTLLKILSRVTAPTSGRLKVKGRIGSLLEVGTGFHPELTGRENVYLNGAILGMKKIEVARKFDEIVDFSGIGHFIDTPVKRYSSGMYVRLAFAVAANLEPEILIVDEVLAVGDVEFQKKCLGKMGDVAGGGRTVLFVSHNMAAITSMCSKVLYLKHGQVVATGNTRDVVGHYLNESGAPRLFDLALEKSDVGDQFVQLLHVRFIDQTLNTVDHLAVDKSFGIEITFDVLLLDAHRPSPNIFIRTRTEERVFLSIETQTSKISKAGVYQSIVWIPDNLLNNETYILTVGISTLNPLKIHCTKDILFEVEDNLTALTRGDFKQRMQGVVRPLLTWETRLLF